jgi:hypothetical protein
LAKSGLINPDTVIETEEGKQYKAIGIGGVEFGSAEKKESPLDAPAEFDSGIITLSADNPFMAVSATPAPVPIPVPTPQPEPVKNKQIDRMLVLCIASFIIPGLGHYLLGCGVWKSAMMLAKAFWTLIVCCVIVGLGIGLLAMLPEMMLHRGYFPLLLGDWGYSVAHLFILFLYIVAFVMVPFLIAFIFFGVHDVVIIDLKSEYEKRMSVTPN